MSQNPNLINPRLSIDFINPLRFINNISNSQKNFEDKTIDLNEKIEGFKFSCSNKENNVNNDNLSSLNLSPIINNNDNNYIDRRTGRNFFIQPRNYIEGKIFHIVTPGNDDDFIKNYNYLIKSQKYVYYLRLLDIDRLGQYQGLHLKKRRRRRD